ncbi:penicillin-binding protein [Collinsella sp. AGMB00827]|uniref:Penicillin-binding protein n=1 Tax=Collinsella ureilytica TaxID=2869515 RepID=A0ABS7MID7_9ACTN|nr:transglycosylase domain-containing protein [Collinsella urealyticum]MBY4797133.1 penicillin-binding protein [Collinsella urealyticum]
MGPRERASRRRAKTHIIPVVLVSLLGFFIIAGVAFGIGMVANVHRWLSDLPDYTNVNAYLASEPTEILDANNNKIASLYVQNRQTTSLEHVSPYVLKGTIATEDSRFYQHNGVDLIGIARATLVQLTGGHEGASTITQQLVRNTILSEEQFDVTIERKVREAFLALKMEEIFNKDEILMMYLNTIYYGHGAYGIQTAAETYLSKSAEDLSLAEAALLIGLPNAPSQYDPTINPDLAVQRRNIVLDRMLENQIISQEEHDAAQAEELTLNVQEIPASGTLAFPYFVDYVRGLLQEEFTTDVIYKGGLTVKTTIDPTIQAQAEQAAVGRLEDLGADSLDVGLIALDPKTGYIKAMVGGRNYYDEAGAHTNHTLSRRSAGSSFKGLTLAAAIHAGMNPSILLNCSSPMNFTVNGERFTVQNYGKINYGVRSLAAATAVSSNTGYIQVQEAIGYGAVADMCKKLGINTTAERAEFVGQPNLTLGTANLTPLEMAEAYATFANGGKHRKAVAITEILSRDGKTLYQHDDKPDQVLSAGEAAAVTEVLKGVLHGGGTGAGFAPSVNQPAAGKTGTAGNNGITTDLWFVGYTPQLCCAIWTGHSGSNANIGYNTHALPLPIFRNFMTAALEGVEREEFPTGDAPAYKENTRWKFSKPLVKEEDEKDEDEEEEVEETEEHGQNQGNLPNADIPENPQPGTHNQPSTGGHNENPDDDRDDFEE